MMLGVAPAQVPVQVPPAPVAPVAPAAPDASAASAAFSAAAGAVDFLSLQESARLAVMNNPEVLQRWHAVRASEGERDAARGGLFPRVDLSAGGGPERRSTIDGRYNRYWGSLTLTQLLYDGFTTANETQRLDHTARARVFDLVAASENQALEAARTYLDVLRYRELVRLAEENYIEHKVVLTQTEARVNARVGRAVDLDQVQGRLALAETNLVTETANLHDTTARFQRIVGRVPSKELIAPNFLERGVPGDANAVLVRANTSNPALLAAIESVRAAQSALDLRKGFYGPRFDLRLRRDQGRNQDGLPGSTNANVAEVVLNWNLFNGLSDSARERQAAEELNVARDTRDRVCRETAQVALIAYNDIFKLQEQMEFLQKHEGAINKALVAYRLQFDIGQRTLLDMLDTENERFQSRRAYINAKHDLSAAVVRMHASAGTLLGFLGISRLESSMDSQLDSWAANGDAARNCPAQPLAIPSVDKKGLNDLAARLVERGAAPVRYEEPEPWADDRDGLTRRPGAAAAPAAGAASAPARPASPAAAAPAPAQAVRTALEDWRAAWARQDVEAYLQAYAAGFVPPKGTREAWEKQRRDVLGRASGVSVTLEDVSVTPDKDRATASFVQTYRSASYQDKVRKTIEWRLADGRWKIERETSEPLAGLPAK